jgi:hypothetical protein
MTVWSVAQAEFDLAQVRRVKAAVMSRIMMPGGFETPDASRLPGRPSQSPEKPKAGEIERTPGRVTTQPDGIADAIQLALSELIKLDRYERRAAARRARALHILLERRK